MGEKCGCDDLYMTLAQLLCMVPYNEAIKVGMGKWREDEPLNLFDFTAYLVVSFTS